MYLLTITLVCLSKYCGCKNMFLSYFVRFSYRSEIWFGLCHEKTCPKSLLPGMIQTQSHEISDTIHKLDALLAHLSRRLVGELIVYPWSGVRPSSTISNISATSRPITMKFYQKHYWDGGKAALGFGPDRIKTLVSMATDSSHRVIM